MFSHKWIKQQQQQQQ